MNQLEYLKQYTTVVADTGDFHQLAQYQPQWRRFGELTATGHPRHPSRLNYAWTLEPYELA